MAAKMHENDDYPDVDDYRDPYLDVHDPSRDMLELRTRRAASLMRQSARIVHAQLAQDLIESAWPLDHAAGAKW